MIQMRLLILNMIGLENLMNKWKCDKCNGFKIEQLWHIYGDMNEDGPFAPNELMDAQSVDSFWCRDCDDECSPFRDKE